MYLSPYLPFKINRFLVKILKKQEVVLFITEDTRSINAFSQSQSFERNLNVNFDNKYKINNLMNLPNKQFRNEAKKNNFEFGTKRTNKIKTSKIFKD